MAQAPRVRRVLPHLKTTFEKVSSKNHFHQKTTFIKKPLLGLGLGLGVCFRGFRCSSVMCSGGSGVSGGLGVQVFRCSGVQGIRVLGSGFGVCLGWGLGV